MINYLFNKLPKKDQIFIESFVDMDIMKIIKYAKKQEMKMELAEINGRYDDAEEIERKVDILNAIIDARAKLN
tara:strand:- start:60 stop:278 length:219 start_codon:yes stop_codon:yes gene_type:complete